jgi:hypothetical protein
VGGEPGGGPLATPGRGGPWPGAGARAKGKQDQRMQDETRQQRQPEPYIQQIARIAGTESHRLHDAVHATAGRVNSTP